MSTERSPDERTEGRSGRPVVLVVDDDEDLADTCEYWLRDDYDVRVAYGGEAALERADESVDVVLLDRRMPNLSGDDVLDELRERGLDCRVAMMTAVEPDTDIVDMPFDEYLVKPVTKTDVRETVEELLVRSDFEDDVREYFALESTESVLDARDVDDLREPGALDSLHDRVETIRREQSAEIERRQRQLDRLHHVNDLLREVDRAIVDATTREEIERTVCESLATAPAYDGAWVARYSETVDSLDCRAAAGISESRLDEEADVLLPYVRECVEDGRPRHVTDLGQRHLDAVFDGGRSQSGGTSDGVSVVVVPVTYRETTYGALGVYASEADAFLEEDLDVLAQLGDSVGNGINAVESKRLLYDDTAVELEFRHEDRGDLFVAVSAETGATLTLKGFSPSATGAVACYVAVEGADGTAVLESLATADGVERARTVTEGANEALVEVSVTSGTVLRTLIDLGASVDVFTVRDGEGTLVVTVSQEVDLRSLTDAVTGAFPAVEVVAKREVERSVQSTGTFKRELEGKLTDRQRDVLETAFVSGYFDWPRGSTAEEVAESLGIAAPTFHEHLRASERKLLEAFFEETSEADEGTRDGEDVRGTSSSD
jgi:predicted DNA binding protein/DNA-binding response OmpR family regulator